MYKLPYCSCGYLAWSTCTVSDKTVASARRILLTSRELRAGRQPGKQGYRISAFKRLHSQSTALALHHHRTKTGPSTLSITQHRQTSAASPTKQRNPLPTKTPQPAIIMPPPTVSLNQLEDRLRTLILPTTPNGVPGAVLLASTPTTSHAYSFATGTTSLNPAEHPHPLTAGSTFWLASCTKLLTSLACLQLVERGVLNLDEPVVRKLGDEFGGIRVLVGWNEDKSPKYSDGGESGKVTLRHLLTHTSGLAYDFLDVNICEFCHCLIFLMSPLQGSVVA